jgi:hypothetical protein
MVQLVIIRKLRYLPVLAHVHHVHFSKETTALISFPLSVRSVRVWILFFW